jgi:hypothetical protein
MTIIRCPLCIEGRIKVHRIADEWGSDYDEDTCPRCNGMYYWRDPPNEWTKIEDLPEDILRDIARVRHYCRIDFDNGRLWLVVYPMYPVPETPDELLSLIEITSRLGHALESHNWLVGY